MTRRGCTSGSIWMAACSTYSAFKPTPRPRKSLSGTSSSQTKLLIIAHTERALQHITACFADAAQLFGLKVRLKKTEVLHHPAPHEDYHLPIIIIDETELKSVQQFTNLLCIISSDTRIDKEVNNRLAKASSAFGRLYKRVWSNKNLKSKTKILVY